ncbi:hypothetical protein [Bowmanella dokdonensis]|uniref:Uncharacterized protein n=1 Tax=Bowmanella dokdonensis TaxID=751969 RepID=A0A939DQR5_9ALTE|nr:hypothetical protein [Bowmanella dokdonensis]MBN7826495.1 hypothetical protein [Bowmanella dokdonensis]
MKAEQIQAAARKALISAEPLYYSWPPERQEQLRASMEGKLQQKVDRVLLQELFGIDRPTEMVEDICKGLSTANKNSLNWARLLTCGIGRDWLFLNELMTEGTSLLDFDTLYDYDYQDYLYQQEFKKAQFPDYQGQNYYPMQHPLWLRLLIHEQFYYATLSSLAGYLVDQIEDKSDDWIQRLIPHEYVDGKDQGKQQADGFLLDFQVRANGLEKHLEELKQRWWQYTQRRWLELSRQFCDTPAAVHCKDRHEKDEQHRQFIFTNQRTLQALRWGHFLTDCKAIQADLSTVIELENQELTKAERWLKDTHQDIMDNFDPKVVKLKKKMKIVVAPGALDGLMGEDGDE